MSRAYAVMKTTTVRGAGKHSRAPQPKPQPKCKLSQRAHIRERSLFPYTVEFLTLAVEKFMPFAQKWQDKVSKMKVEKFPSLEQRSPQSLWIHTHVSLKSIVQILIVYINREFQLPDHLVQEAKQLKIKQDNRLAWFFKRHKLTTEIISLIESTILSGFIFRTKALPQCNCDSRGYDHFPFYQFNKIILEALKECIPFE